MHHGGTELRATATPRAECVWGGGGDMEQPRLHRRPHGLRPAPQDLASQGSGRVRGSQMKRAAAAQSPEHLKSSPPYPVGMQLKFGVHCPWSSRRHPALSPAMGSGGAPGNGQCHRYSTASAPIGQGSRACQGAALPAASSPTRRVPLPLAGASSCHPGPRRGLGLRSLGSALLAAALVAPLPTDAVGLS
jgi:hypothetical protein